MRTKSVDMLNGSLLRSTFKFTLPLVATYLLSQLFSVTDMIVVGRLCGSKCVAAIGATGSLVALIVNFFLGVSAGAGIVVAQYYGAKDGKNLSKAVHTAVPTSFAAGAILTVVGLVFAKKMLVLMGTPEDIIEMSTLYLKIYFVGIILRMVYTFAAAILRAVGDSKTPLKYLTLGGIMNVGFNLFFVLVFNMNVDGVAWGTIISEGISGILCLIALMRRRDEVRFTFRNMFSGFDFKILKRIMVIGVPAGVQSCLFSIANVLLQSSVNSFGTTVVAGNAAAASLGTFTYLSANATSTTASNFMGQNYGAKRYDRIKKLPGVCLFWMVAGTLIVAGITRIFANELLGLYITDNPKALEIGIIRLQIVTMTYVLCGVMDIYSGLLRGIGKSISAMWISLICVCGFRVAFIFTVFKLDYFHKIEWLYSIYPVSWIIAIIVDTIYYRHVLKRKMEEDAFSRSQANGSDRLYSEIREKEAAEKQNAAKETTENG